MANEIDSKALYKIKHPRTGKVVEWTGDRIKAYQIINRCDVSFAPKPKKKSKPETDKVDEVETNSENLK